MMKKFPTKTLPITPATYLKTFKIIRSNIWLEKKDEALLDLFSMCENADQADLVAELIEKFKFVYDEEFNKACEFIFENIETDKNFCPDNTVIAALYNDRRADSSKVVLHRLKKIIKEKRSPFREFDSAFEAIYLDGITNIILVDEFIGSGTQAIRIINSLREKCSENNFDIKFHIMTTASMKYSMNTILNHATTYTSNLWLKKGISEGNNFPERKKKLKAMCEIEDKLLSEVNLNGRQKKMQSLGFKKSQCLYKYENSTTPNNVFPIFHWPWNLDGSERPTLLPLA